MPAWRGDVGRAHLWNSSLVNHVVIFVVGSVSSDAMIVIVPRQQQHGMQAE